MKFHAAILAPDGHVSAKACRDSDMIGRNPVSRKMMTPVLRRSIAAASCRAVLEAQHIPCLQILNRLQLLPIDPAGDDGDEKINRRKANLVFHDGEAKVSMNVFSVRASPHAAVRDARESPVITHLAERDDYNISLRATQK